MLFKSFLLASSLWTQNPDRAFEVARDAWVVALDEPPLFPCQVAGDVECYDGRTQTALLLVAWVFKESSGIANVTGDNGWSIGAMQFRRTWLTVAPLAAFSVSVKDVLADRKLAMRMGLTLLRTLRDDCGSVLRGLYAYASGSCGGTPAARRKAHSRLATVARYLELPFTAP